MGACEIRNGRGDFLRPIEPADIDRNHIPHAAAFDLLPGLAPAEARGYVDQQLFNRLYEDGARGQDIRRDASVLQFAGEGDSEIVPCCKGAKSSGGFRRDRAERRQSALGAGIGESGRDCRCERM